MKRAQAGVRGKSRAKGDDRLTDGWETPSAPAPTGRGILVAHLRSPANRGGYQSLALPGIEIHDLELPETAHLIDRVVCFDGLSLEFAAFFIGGFYVDPQAAGKAMGRITGLVADHDPSALKVNEAHVWLKQVFGPKPIDHASSQRFIISPDELLTALHERSGAPETNLLRLIFAAHRVAQHRLKQPAEALALAKLEWNVADDDASGSTTNSRKALYLLAVAAGLVQPKGRFSDGVEQVQAAITNGYLAVKAEHPYMLPKPNFSLDALGDYLRSGANELDVNPAGPRGRPSKADGPSK